MTLKKLLLTILVGAVAHCSSAQESENEVQQHVDSIVQSLKFEYGTVQLMDGKITLNVPQGYKYLNGLQSNTVLTDLWGNPPSETLGMLFPETMLPTSDNFTFAVELSYADEGYIEDEDAADIDYDELLEEMISDTQEASKSREEMGYGSVALIGWASKPYYDAEHKKLHWAKELMFNNNEVHTLNYNIRVLGRDGYLNMNAIGDMEVLPTFNKDVNLILESVSFNDGYAYEDFDSSIDKVAAYGIGGLVAGKVLTKLGLFALIAKFWKLIAVGAVGLFSAFKKKIFGSKEA